MENNSFSTVKINKAIDFYSIIKTLFASLNRTLSRLGFYYFIDFLYSKKDQLE